MLRALFMSHSRQELGSFLKIDQVVGIVYEAIVWVTYFIDNVDLNSSPFALAGRSKDT